MDESGTSRAASSQSASTYEETLLKPQGRVLSTLESDGSRRWLHPRLSRGRFWQARRIVAYALIAIFTLIPFTTINGKPAILLDIVNRRFTLFGYTFLPTDTLLLALFMVGLILSIFAFTAVLGRVWCGWACPQTVYMEFVYRPLQRLLGGRTGVGGPLKHRIEGWRAVVLYALYLLISFYLANTFLAYFVGVENLKRWVFGSPLEHPVAFTVVVVVTGLMMFDFAIFREQLCIIACPYGRLQSVLLDRQSLIVSYDARRGEPRGRLRRDDPRTAATASDPAAKKGDCVDCGMCVQVCPTGIDIRDGLQVECVACTQCIDACDAVMDRIGTPRGLIRYTSQSAVSGEPARVLRPRVILYAIVFAALATLLTVLIVTKSPVDLTVLRNIGRPFNVLEDGVVENALHLKVTNRTDEPRQYRVEVASPPGVRLVGSREVLPLRGGEMISEPVRVLAPVNLFQNGGLDITIRLTGSDGATINRPYRLLGPFRPVGPEESR